MERDHVSSPSQVFQNFYLSLDFLFLDWLQDFNDNLLTATPALIDKERKTKGVLSRAPDRQLTNETIWARLFWALFMDPVA